MEKYILLVEDCGFVKPVRIFIYCKLYPRFTGWPSVQLFWVKLTHAILARNYKDVVLEMVYYFVLANV